jgi:hypothetical protein
MRLLGNIVQIEVAVPLLTPLFAPSYCGDEEETH